MTAQCLNVLGLCLNMAGVALAFVFGFPQPNLGEGINLVLANSADHDAKQRARKLLYRRMSLLALLFMLLGFAAQLSALYLP